MFDSSCNLPTDENHRHTALSFFIGARLENNPGQSGASIYTKDLFTSHDFAFRKIVIEVLHGRAADASLMALKNMALYEYRKSETGQGWTAKAL